MVTPGKAPEKMVETYNFKEVAEILNLKDGKKIIGRTGLMQILKICNVLNRQGTAFLQFVDEGYFSNHTINHQPRVEFRDDDYALVIGAKGLDFVKGIIENYLVDKKPPFPPPTFGPSSGQLIL